MFRVLLTTVAVAGLYGCAPGYVWVNSEFPPEEMEDRLVMDKGACIREADRTYPEPYPMEDPDNDYYDCMASTMRREMYPVRTRDGRIVYRTVTDRGDSYLCRPRRGEREAYREYEWELRRQRANQAQYINSCLRFMGWEQIPLQ